MGDEDLIEIFESVQTIALVGYSANPARPSHRVAQFLKDKGYRVIPVNPGLAGQQALGETVYANLTDIPNNVVVDMIDIFRRPEAVTEIVEEALAELPGLRHVWMQLGVINEEAADLARRAGKAVIMDRCPAIEYPRVMQG
ncbi:CoA-binding protein [Rhodobacteraceae bacterium]|nr:CoA-binding protein [Paracoccaceae bacterium]